MSVFFAVKLYGAVAEHDDLVYFPTWSALPREPKPTAHQFLSLLGRSSSRSVIVEAPAAESSTEV